MPRRDPGPLPIAPAHTEGWHQPPSSRKWPETRAGLDAYRALTESPRDEAQVLGIPAAQLTEPVRHGIGLLMEEIHRLRWELEQARQHLAHLESTADQHGDLPLLNRHAFMRELGHMITYTTRTGTPCTLVLFRFPELMTLRRTRGRAASTALLSFAARLLRAELRTTDLLGTLEDGDLAAVLVHGEAAPGGRRANDLARTLEQEPLVWPGGNEDIVVEIGVHALERIAPNRVHAVNRIGRVNPL